MAVDKRVLAIAITGIVLAGGMVGSAYFLSRFMLKVQNTHENTIEVKGVAEQEIKADIGTFSVTIQTESPTVREGFARINSDNAKVMARLRKEGFKDGELTEDNFESYSVNRTIREGDRRWEVFSHFNCSKTIQVRSANVELVRSVALRLEALLLEGVDIRISTPKFLVTNLEQYKLELITAATNAGIKRASAIAEQCHARVGRILTARQGVIQINRPGSVEDSYSGVYDTTTIEKVIRIVVTLDVGILK